MFIVQVHRLVDAMSNSQVTMETGLVLKELQTRSWLGTHLNPCAMTKAEYLKLVMELAPITANKGEYRHVVVVGSMTKIIAHLGQYRQKI
jgi:hypothetical protein